MKGPFQVVRRETLTDRCMDGTPSARIVRIGTKEKDYGVSRDGDNQQSLLITSSQFFYRIGYNGSERFRR